MPYFIISYVKQFQNSGLSNFWGGWRLEQFNVGPWKFFLMLTFKWRPAFIVPFLWKAKDFNVKGGRMSRIFCRSKMEVVQTCEVLNLHHLTWVYNSLLPDRYVKDEHVLITQFLWESKKYERECRLRVKKIYKYVLFYGDNLWTVAIRQMKFGAVKDNGHNE
jgi:hypothetical protein